MFSNPNGFLHVNERRSMTKIGSRETAVASVLGALSAMSEVISGPPFDVPFPLLPWISWDVTGIPIMVSLFLYGPITGVYTCLIGCSVIFLRGNVYGGVLKVIAELATLLAFTILRKGVATNTVGAITSRVLVMTVANFFLLQLFYGTSEPDVVGLLVPIGLFNVTQALINIIPAYFISLRVKVYKT
jgi:riboflavin transporter FmnP